MLGRRAPAIPGRKPQGQQGGLLAPPPGAMRAPTGPPRRAPSPGAAADVPLDGAHLERGPAPHAATPGPRPGRRPAPGGTPAASVRAVAAVMPCRLAGGPHLFPPSVLLLPARAPSQGPSQPLPLRLGAEDPERDWAPAAGAWSCFCWSGPGGRGHCLLGKVRGPSLLLGCLYLTKRGSLASSSQPC